MSRRELWAPFVAVLAATLSSFLFDLGVAVARGWNPAPGYVAVCAALSIGAALVLGAGFAWSRRPELALATWLGLNVMIGAVLNVPPGWLAAAGFMLVTWAALLPNDRRRESPVGLGLGVGLGLSVVAVILPRLFGVIGLDRPLGRAYELTAMAALGGLLLAHSLYVRHRRGLRWLPPETPLTAAVLLLLALLVPLALTGSPSKARIDVSAAGAPAGAEAGPLVIVVVLDTVRADRLSLYGHERDTTPVLRAWVESHERAVVYPLAFSQASWTLPAHASLFTGLVPSDHGVHSGRLLTLRNALAPGTKLEAEKTLGEVMQEHGFRTAAVLANAGVMYFAGMDRGFDQVVLPPSKGWLALTGEKLRQRLTPWSYAHTLKAYPDAATISGEVFRFLDHCGAARCFVVANYMEAHWPFAAPPPFGGAFTDGRWRGVEDLRYDEEILGLDTAIGELLGGLEERGMLDRAWVVITSDHGEEFGEHGAYAHGTSIYNPQVRIPLIVHPPRGESVAEHPHAVGLIDVTATLSAAIGAERLGSGRDLRTIGSAAAAVGIEWYGHPDIPPPERTTGRAVVLGSSKLIDSMGAQELYRLDRDPHEQNDVAAEGPGDVARLAELLPRLDATRPEATGRETELPVDEIERLRALGYTE
ncbi:MAG: sulfatase [Myxococcota bacterium]|nr:sulfatase [Myxococcota bacterium]